MARGWMRSFFAAAVLAVAGAGSAHADVDEIRVATQYGISYLPLMVMQQDHLVERHAAASGLKGVKVTWLQFSSGSAMNDAILSGNLQFASGGVAPLVMLWDRTHNNLRVHGVASLNSMPIFLNSNNPRVRSVRDFTDHDRIALPAIKVSGHAVLLEMAAARAFGPAQANRLDHLTVSMAHPDAHNALMSGHTEITAHFGAPPFQYEQLTNPRIHTVLSSYDVLGGKSTFNLVWTTERFRAQNPKAYAAFVAALNDAMAIINRDKLAAAKLYLQKSGDHIPLRDLMRIMNDPNIEFTTTPKGMMRFASFMHQQGTIHNSPSTWKEMFFPEAQGLPGN